MSKNQINKDELKCFVERLKKELHDDQNYYYSDPKFLANSYLDKVLDKISHYRY
jgi:protein involved in sex pheromone biosynthesis